MSRLEKSPEEYLVQVRVGNNNELEHNLDAVNCVGVDILA